MMNTATALPHGCTENLAPLVITFSGIDGAGKSSQIERLVSYLTDCGLQVSVVRFWEDVVLLRRMRESLGHALFKGDRGAGTPDKPVRRMDKNVKRGYMLPIRLFFCLLDTVGLALTTAKIRRRSDVDVIIFDRYIYDQIANLNITNRLIQFFARLLLRATPRPGAAYVLDAEPSLACVRKPEYPLDFVTTNRLNYRLVSATGGLTLIPPGTLEQVEQAIRCDLENRSHSPADPTGYHQ